MWNVKFFSLMIVTLSNLFSIYLENKISKETGWKLFNKTPQVCVRLSSYEKYSINSISKLSLAI